MFDPILVNTLMGHDQVNEPQGVKAHSKQSSSRRRLQRSGDRGTVAEIAERLRASREQPVIRRGRRIRKAHFQVGSLEEQHQKQVVSLDKHQKQVV
ncbi:hypothetical protein DY000_02040043 [Brassica cretica]|uniref:Uncharacterized protein n=1 Tax=Brassica cretica TaxID=69181 RepID=A0ABQ7BNH1_BRACR|nr:hypothetical protein DY000_02040043 [Brassica cretica]